MVEQRSVEEQIQAAQDKVAAVLNDPNVPKIYVNAFLSGFNNTDFTLLLESNGKPAAILNLSYPLAKTLAQSILGIITGLETVSGQKFLTMEEMEQYRQNMTSVISDQS